MPPFVDALTPTGEIDAAARASGEHLDVPAFVVATMDVSLAVAQLDLHAGGVETRLPDVGTPGDHRTEHAMRALGTHHIEGAYFRRRLSRAAYREERGVPVRDQLRAQLASVTLRQKLHRIIRVHASRAALSREREAVLEPIT